ncbi:MAG: glycoside hydrolase [Clostridiales bacterium]|nr:glycoside hydrolase [Clostridiales bacterium]
MGDKSLLFCGSSELFLKKELTKYSNKANGGAAFRIPSIINAGGTLVAAIDRASSGMDWGYIEIAIRRSEDGGKTWGDLQVVAIPPARETQISGDNYSSAFFIDPCMALDKDGNIIMFVDFWPECKGLFSKNTLDKKKAPYGVLGGKKLPLIYDRDGKFYYVEDNGQVLDSTGGKTEYTVKGCGYLYNGGEYIGNIFLNGSTASELNEMGAKTTFGAPLKAPKRSYIYMLKSTDKGKTWSEPKDVTGDFLSKKDGTFLGIAPGVGLTASNGRILMPLYIIRCGLSALSVYSDDCGKTWKRNSCAPYCRNKDEWQLVETDNGILIGLGRQTGFGKTPVSISYDTGKTWAKAKKTKLYAPKCQKSLLMLENDYILCSHASKKKRADGVISVGRVITDGGAFKEIKWLKDVVINNGFFAYSCLVRVDAETVGVMYESQPSSYIEFQTYKIGDFI